VFVTTTGTVPVALSLGACTFNCPGLIYHTAALLPLMVTLTPSSFVGSVFPTKSPVCQARLVADRFAPMIETQEPLAMAAAKLAPFETPVIVTGGDAGAASRQRIRRFVESEKQTRPFASRPT